VIRFSTTSFGSASGGVGEVAFKLLPHSGQKRASRSRTDAPHEGQRCEISIIFDWQSKIGNA